MRSISQILRVKDKTDSPIEELLYQEFLVYGVEPVCQHQVGAFRIDLAFPEIKLAIEADGHAFHSTPEQKTRDEYREKRITSQGWTVERYTGKYIHKEFELIVARIVLKYFETKLSEELKLRATGRVVNYFTKKDPRFAEGLTEAFMKGYLYKKV